MTRNGYKEETLIGPGNAEVYGMDGYGWYTTQRTAETLPYVWRDGPNPIFKHLIGATRDSLFRDGFASVED